MSDLHLMATRAREAAWQLASAPLERRNAALEAMIEGLWAAKETICAANEADRAQARKRALPRRFCRA